jgi:beta-phosphoglucomutase family hydrolase
MTNGFAVIFDMDGVLVDNNKYHNIAWLEFCKRKNFKVTNEDITSRFGNLNDEYFKFLYGRQLPKEESEKLGEEKESIYREIYEKEIQPAEGLINLLEELKSNGFKIGVATSANTHNLNFVLDKTNIRSFFDATVDSSMVTKGKPDPEVFLKAAELLNVSPSKCLIFEDSVHGVEAACNAHIKVVALTTTFVPEKLKDANLIIKGFPEIGAKTILDIINS